MIGAQGFLTCRIKYLRSKYNEKSVPNVEEVSAQLTETQISPENDLKFLKDCVVENTDRNLIVSKLKFTQKQREAMMHDENVDLRMSFPFFFANPHLVIIF